MQGITTTIALFLITLTLPSATAGDTLVAEHATEVEDALVTQPGVDALLDLLGKKSPSAHGRRLGPFSRGYNPNRSYRRSYRSYRNYRSYGSGHDASYGDGSCDCQLVSPDGTKCMDPEDIRNAELFFQSPKVDADGNGSLDLPELKNCIQYFVNATLVDGEKVSDTYVKIDANGDGKIDQREFVAVILADKQTEAWSRSQCQGMKDRYSCIKPPLLGLGGKSSCFWTPGKSNGAQNYDLGELESARCHGGECEEAPRFPVWAVAVVAVLATGVLVTVVSLAVALKRRRTLATVATAAVVTPVATKEVALNVV